ncbi:MAG: hypothetical protein MR436_02930 [Eubacterium sp.]|nr:hypothetical protein [Eubacterium sp.]
MSRDTGLRKFFLNLGGQSGTDSTAVNMAGLRIIKEFNAFSKNDGFLQGNVLEISLVDDLVVMIQFEFGQGLFVSEKHENAPYHLIRIPYYTYGKIARQERREIIHAEIF